MNELTENPAKPSNLNPKQERFAQEYVIDSNGKQAAIRAGYSPKTAEVKACQLLRIIKVSQYVQQLRDEVAERLGITHHYVLKSVKDGIEQCKKDNPTGNPLGVFKGAELLGKHIGTFEGDQVKGDTPQWTGVEIDFGDGKLKVVTGTGKLPTNED